MNNTDRIRLAAFASLFALITGVGCATPSQPARFYVLTSLTGAESTRTAESALTRSSAIGVGPVILPEYLQRPQIVTRSGANELRLDEFNRWAGSLEKDFSRVVAENLSQLLGTDTVITYPWTQTMPLDYQIEMEVAHFDGRLGGDVTLKVRWAVFGRKGESPLLVRMSDITEPSGGSGYGALVAAHSRAVDRLSREIAVALNGLIGQ